MPTYTYTARDSNGSPSNGTMVADSVQEVTLAMRREGKYLTSIRLGEEAAPARAARGHGRRGIRIPRKDVIAISTQLAIMVETGVTLSEALECISQQAEKPRVKQLLEDIVHSIHSGTDLSTALSRHERSFPRLYVALIRASEKSGMMGKLLARATNYLRDENETVRRVKGALIYPTVMLSFCILATTFLLAFVLPKFTAIYASKGAALPRPTRILMGISDFLINHKISLPIGVALGLTALIMLARTVPGRRAMHYVQLHVPLLGAMFRKLHLARSLRMIGTMSGAGIPINDAVTTANDLCENVYFQELWTGVLGKIQHGKQLWESLIDQPLVPRSIVQMVLSGEKSGKLSLVLEQISGFAEQELKEQIAELTRYIEPLMIMIMGVIIGGVALALLLPVFSISRVVAN